MYNTMRITGLASGIDTEEMIQNLMKAERVKVDRVEQDRQTVLWRQEAYNSLNKDFANFILNTRKMFGLTTVSRTGSFLPNSYQNLNWIKKATSSNESVATVSSTGKALDGTYKVKVTQLAEGVSLASGDKIGGSEILTGKESISFTINGKVVTVNKTGDKDITMSDVVKAINSIEDIGVRASYDAGIDRFFLQTTGTGEDAKIKITAEGIGADFIDALNLNVNGVPSGNVE